MVTCDYLLICNFTWVDEHRHACLIGIYDGLAAAHPPIDLPRMGISSAIHSTPGARHQLALVVLDSGGIPLNGWSGEVICGALGASSASVNLGPTRFVQAGRHAVVLMVDDQEIQRAPLTITFAGIPGSQRH